MGRSKTRKPKRHKKPTRPRKQPRERIDPKEPFLAQYRAAAGHGAVVELKLRMLAGVIPELSYLETSDRLEGVDVFSDVTRLLDKLAWIAAEFAVVGTPSAAAQSAEEGKQP